MYSLFPNKSLSYLREEAILPHSRQPMFIDIMLSQILYLCPTQQPTRFLAKKFHLKNISYLEPK